MVELQVAILLQLIQIQTPALVALVVVVVHMNLETQLADTLVLVVLGQLVRAVLGALVRTLAVAEAVLVQ